MANSNSECECIYYYVDPDTGAEYESGGGDRLQLTVRHPDCPLHGDIRPVIELKIGEIRKEDE